MHTNVELMLQKELTLLNHAIDIKILKGLSYTREARRHKYLLARLLAAKKSARSSMFTRFISSPKVMYR